jgi:hypothetical protein
VAWISQYSSWTFRFHQVAGHEVGSSHSAQVPMTGRPARVALAIL